MTRTTTYLACALALSACVSSAAAAPLRNDITVSFSDLDISHTAGAKILLQRIETAARSVCGGSGDLRDLSAFRLAQTCMKDTVETAIRTVPSPLVAKLYGAPQLYAGEARFDVAAK